MPTSTAHQHCPPGHPAHPSAARLQLQLSARAYVHHYERFGASADFIAERVELVKQVVDDYGDLAGALLRPAGEQRTLGGLRGGCR